MTKRISELSPRNKWRLGLAVADLVLTTILIFRNPN
ncbi:hypothetical protein SEA_ROSE5_49 [Mycobacterium phage Rose5]|nr:hypothetical protein SEA_ACQUIRE49_50 [Mycobacterium phage Acquire49]QGJ92454.1 hypothetical protein SEA_WYATT2_50 [Mycobacterium phage Wyatt2]QGJ93069.1 hypothetical protein SEA_ZARIA_50 [Mycobacterium phage Zaria]QOC56714.1 hypothetical protein SEA_TYSON_49 [Mycobacterium phage Tyson]QWT30577.1 hypothetical protein SEA_ROSE5_49 [Mycobacterium phage Rose5]WMI34643.1 hypothetical protein SEA_CALM_50 [Mycobacterium phage Calm]